MILNTKSPACKAGPISSSSSCDYHKLVEKKLNFFLHKRGWVFRFSKHPSFIFYYFPHDTCQVSWGKKNEKKMKKKFVHAFRWATPQSGCFLAKSFREPKRTHVFGDMLTKCKNSPWGRHFAFQNVCIIFFPVIPIRYPSVSPQI
jgi:hypothetical protein